MAGALSPPSFPHPRPFPRHYPGAIHQVSAAGSRRASRAGFISTCRARRSLAVPHAVGALAAMGGLAPLSIARLASVGFTPAGIDSSKGGLAGFCGRRRVHC